MADRSRSTSSRDIVSRYFPEGRDVFFFDPNVLISRFPTHSDVSSTSSSSTRTLFEIEKCLRLHLPLREDSNEVPESLPLVLLFGPSFGLKRVILSRIVSGLSGFLPLLHSLSLSSPLRPSYGLRVDCRWNDDTETVDSLTHFFSLDPFRLLAIPLPDLVQMPPFIDVLSCVGRTSGVARQYVRETFLDRYGILRHDQVEATAFFEFLKSLTGVLRFGVSEVNLVLKLLVWIVVLLDGNQDGAISPTEIIRMRSKVGLPSSESRHRVLACFIHTFLLRWMVQWWNQILVRERLVEPGEGMVSVSRSLEPPLGHFFVFPEPPPQPKHKDVDEWIQEKQMEEEMRRRGRRRRRKGRRKEKEEEESRRCSFRDFCDHVLLSHLYVLGYRAAEEGNYPSEIRFVFDFLKLLNQRQFLLFRNLKMALLTEIFIEPNDDDQRRRRKRRRRRDQQQQQQQLTLLEKRRWLVEEEGLLEIAHPFGIFRYDLRSFLYRRRWQYEYDSFLQNLHSLFHDVVVNPSSSSSSSSLPGTLLLFVDHSIRELLCNPLTAKFLHTKMEMDAERRQVRKVDVRRSIRLLQSCIRTSLVREEYEMEYVHYRSARLRKLRQKWARIRLQRWWRRQRVLLRCRRDLAAMTIQRWYRQLLEDRRQNAARVIQYHCQKFLCRRVDEWMNNLLTDTVVVMQKGWRKYAQTDSVLQKRKQVTDYLTDYTPSSNALSLQRLLSRRDETTTSAPEDDDYDEYYEDGT